MGSRAAWAHEPVSPGEAEHFHGAPWRQQRKIVCGLLILEQIGQSQERGGTLILGGHPIRGQPVATPWGQKNLLDCADLKEKEKLHYLKNQEAHKSPPNAGGT